MLCTAVSLVFSFLFLAIWWQRKYWIFIWKVNGVRGVVHQPLLWMVLMMFMDPSTILSVVCRVRQCFKSPLVVYLGRRLLLYVDDPVSAEQILNSPDCLDKTFMQDGFFARKGLLHAKGQQWKIRRKQLNPAFNTNILLSFFPTFNEVSNRLQNKFNTLLGNDIAYVDIEDLIGRAVLDVACQTTMGSLVNFLEEDRAKMAACYKTLMHISAVKIVKPWLQNDLIFRLVNRELYDCEQKCNQVVDDFVNRLVTRKYCEWQQSRVLDLTNDIENWRDVADSEEEERVQARVEMRRKSLAEELVRKRIFIEQLFHLAEIGELTLQEIIDEAHSMVMVASETVTNNLLITLLLLAINPEFQRRLHQEIQRLFPTQRPTNTQRPDDIVNNITDITTEHLKQMPYLDMVVHETLRLLTTVPMNSRNVNRDLSIRFKEFNAPTITIPAGTIIVLDVFNMQRDPKYWGSRSMEFYPEHFAEQSGEDGERERSRHPYAFIPFSKGLRWCIGGRYSIWLTKILLIRLIQNFEFETDTKLEDLNFIEGVTLKFSNSERIKFNIKRVLD